MYRERPLYCEYLTTYMTIDIHFLLRYRLQGNASDITLHSVIQYSFLLWRFDGGFSVAFNRSTCTRRKHCCCSSRWRSACRPSCTSRTGTCQRTSPGLWTQDACLNYACILNFRLILRTQCQAVYKDTLYNCNEHSYNVHIQIFARYRPHRRWLISLV